MRVENTGFKTHVENNVVVAAGATVPLDVVMEVGATQQTIEVQANAAILTTETARVATEVSAKLVDESAAGRERRGAQPLRPGGHHGGSRRQRGSNFRVGGGRIGAFGMTLDGTAATVARPDAQVSLGADQRAVGGGAHRIQRGVRRIQGRDRPRFRRHR